MTNTTPRLRESVEPIPGLDERTVGGFWQWAYSDILSNRIAGLLGFFILFGTFAEADVRTVDITPIVLTKTDLPRQLNAQCDNLAAGNEKACWLHQALVHLNTSGPTSQVEAQLRLRSRHEVFSGAVLYDDTAHVTVRLYLDNETCETVDVKVDSSNEIYKLLISIFRDDIADQIRAAGSPCRL